MTPRQMNFAQEWNTSIKLIRGRPKVVAGMDVVAKHWCDIAEFKFDETREHDAIQADAEFQLELLTFSVMQWDLHWLQEWTRGCSDIVAPLSFGIAETLYPDEDWEIIDRCDYVIVTNRRRTMVFDFHNFAELPAGASLVLAEDTIYQPSELDVSAATEYLERWVAEEEERLRNTKAHIEYFEAQSQDNVIPLK